jgi:outer membrane lipoprotein-sorting protein
LAGLAALSIISSTATTRSADKDGALPETAASTAAVLARIETDFKNTGSLRADFTQTNKISLFDKAIVLKGKVAIDYPDGFKWTVLSPVKTTVEINAGRAMIWDGATGETKTFDRGDNPMMDMMWRQLGAWFMGRYDELSKDYDISVTDSNADNPTLLFKPKNELIAKVVDNVSLTFAKDSAGRLFLEKVLMREKSGDSTTVLFSNVVLKGAVGEKSPDAK